MELRIELNVHSLCAQSSRATQKLCVSVHLTGQPWTVVPDSDHHNALYRNFKVSFWASGINFLPMQIQCECGKFRAEIKAFPKNTPGRLKCYCDDCQAYLHHLNRTDLLDQNAGTEVIPAYPADVQIVSGGEFLKCVRLSDNGMHRYFTSCCNTPIGNTRPNMPWIGLHRRVYTVQDPDKLDQTLGPVRSRVMGRYAKGEPPAGTPKTFNLKAFATVMPFLLRGKLFKKYKPSPFFGEDGHTSIVIPQVLSASERKTLRNSYGV